MASHAIATREWFHTGRRAVCPECHGHGYTTIEVTAPVVLWDPEYPVTIPVTHYRTQNCWRCHGAGFVRED